MLVGTFYLFKKGGIVMLNMNEKSDYVNEAEKGESFEEASQNQFEFYDSNYNVNFFGVGNKEIEGSYKYEK